MSVTPDLETRLAALEARVRELEQAARVEYSMPPLFSLKTIFVGTKRTGEPWLGPRGYE